MPPRPWPPTSIGSSLSIGTLNLEERKQLLGTSPRLLSISISHHSGAGGAEDRRRRPGGKIHICISKEYNSVEGLEVHLLLNGFLIALGRRAVAAQSGNGGNRKRNLFAAAAADDRVRPALVAAVFVFTLNISGLA